MSAHTHLQAIFEAERNLRRAEERLFASEDCTEVLVAAVGEAAELSDRFEASLRLERLADLCAQVPSRESLQALLTILNQPEPSVRVAAGEALLDVAYERYAEVARTLENALERGFEGPAMSELPHIVAEIGEPSAAGLIRGFLYLEDAEAVAAAIEALSVLGDPLVVPDLEALLDDPREVAFEEFDEETRTSIGDLAAEAISQLGFEG